MPTDPTPQAEQCGKTHLEHKVFFVCHRPKGHDGVHEGADKGGSGEVMLWQTDPCKCLECIKPVEPFPAPQAPEGRLCGCIEDGKPCFKACGNDLTGWVCELETGLRQAPLVPNEELAQRLIRNTKGWMQERIRELESALTAAQAKLDRQEIQIEKTNEAVEYWRDKYKHEEARWCKAAAEVGRVREERDRAKEALLFMYESLRGRLMNEEKDKVLRALNPVLDRQPEGER